MKIFYLINIKLKTLHWIFSHILMNWYFEIWVDHCLLVLIVIKILENLQWDIFILLELWTDVLFERLIRFKIYILIIKIFSVANLLRWHDFGLKRIFWTIFIFIQTCYLLKCIICKLVNNFLVFRGIRNCFFLQLEEKLGFLGCWRSEWLKSIYLLLLFFFHSRSLFVFQGLKAFIILWQIDKLFVLSLTHFLYPIFLLINEILIFDIFLLKHSLLLLDLKLKQEKLTLLVWNIF